MKNYELIAKLRQLPPYADVLIEEIDGNGDGCGFLEFSVAAGDDFPESKTALIIIAPKAARPDSSK